MNGWEKWATSEPIISHEKIIENKSVQFPNKNDIIDSLKFEIFITSKKGRGIRAKKQYSKGEYIFAELPVTFQVQLPIQNQQIVNDDIFESVLLKHSNTFENDLLLPIGIIDEKNATSTDTISITNDITPLCENCLNPLINKESIHIQETKTSYDSNFNDIYQDILKNFPDLPTNYNPKISNPVFYSIEHNYFIGSIYDFPSYPSKLSYCSNKCKLDALKLYLPLLLPTIETLKEISNTPSTVIASQFANAFVIYTCVSTIWLIGLVSIRALCILFMRLYNITTKRCGKINSWYLYIQDTDWDYALYIFNTFSRPRYTKISLDTEFSKYAIESFTCNFNQLLNTIWPGINDLCTFIFIDTIIGCIATNLQLYQTTIQNLNTNIIGSLFPLHACLNHSCIPNAHIWTPIHLNPHPMALKHPNGLFVQAIKDISVGDEITISYLDGDTASSKRFSWTCLCDSCLAS